VAYPVRYRFADFVVSCSQRQLLRQGKPLPLIPRYFDLLVLLIERRYTAVSRSDIFDRVWNDVIVSDGALSQAVRTLRRTLGDDSREPIFIRTVSRYGYSFVFPDVAEESDDPAQAVASTKPAPPEPVTTTPDRLGELIQRLTRPANAGSGDEEDQRDAAEQLHLLGTATALERVIAQSGHARALALLRDARWNVPGAGRVPLLGQPEGLSAAWCLIRLRAAQAFAVARSRCATAAAGAALAGVVGGVVGGLTLINAPGAQAPVTAIAVLAVLGGLAGASGGFGVAAGVGAGEALARSWRAASIVAGGASGGAAVGLVAHALVRWTLESLFGLHVPITTGLIEGVVLGGAAAVGYAITTRRPGGGGIATPAGRARWTTVFAVATSCALGGILLASMGRPLVGGLISAIAQASRGSQLALTPLGALVGDPAFTTTTKVLLAILECGLFGAGLAWGLTKRPAGRRSSPSPHDLLTPR
jgi:DNA-binding winged helix-turn-helix (wHTH) protein